MFFKKPLPPAHFHRFVATKESWENVWQQLEFRPKTTQPSLRRQSIDAATESAITSMYLLLAVAHFKILAATDQRIVSVAGEEQILLECLAFASSVVCNGVNPESDVYEMLLDSRQSLVPSFNLMSLLDSDEIEDTAMSRFELYDKASTATDREAYLCDSHARVITYMAGGEHNSLIQIRYEDPPNLVYHMAAQEFLFLATGKLKEMISRIVKREMDEDDF